MTERIEEAVAKANIPVRVVKSEVGGRYYVASRPISRGECILSEIPYACIVDESKVTKVCNSCFKYSLDGDWTIHCKDCDEVYYCSEACEEREKDVHSLECEVFKNVDHSLESTLTNKFRVMKIVIRLIMYKRLNKPRRIFSSEGKQPEVHCKFDMIENLLGHGGFTTYGKGAKAVNHIFSILNVTDSEEKELVPKLYCAHETNSYTMWSKGEQGECLYAVGSYFNHSCAPNLVRRESGNKLELVAAYDLPEGTDLTISYTNIDVGLASRKDALKSGFCFDCACARCTHESQNTTPYTLPNALSAFECIFPSCPSFGKPLQKPVDDLQKYPFPVSHMCTTCYKEKVYTHLWSDQSELASKYGPQ